LRGSEERVERTRRKGGKGESETRGGGIRFSGRADNRALEFWKPPRGFVISHS